ncbi:MAG TPA: hypothetical protein VFW75_00080 [Acetobacteraceae bacterium]|nr:hypothetical protein [Acetobacteraceae bacterium]
MAVVVDSQAFRSQKMKLPSIAFQSAEADVCSRDNSDLTDESDATIGAVSSFHETHGYCAYRISTSGWAGTDA